MKCSVAVVVLCAALIAEAKFLSKNQRLNDVTDDAVHLCSCSERAPRNDPLRGCDPQIRLRRLQVGRISSPGQVHFKFKLQLDRPLPKPRVDFTLTKLMIRLPCMAGYGSCSYSLCGRENYSIEEQICNGWGCQCPVQPGTYYSGLVSINMPDLRPLGPAAYGPVKVDIKFREGARIIHCTSFKINVYYPSKNVTENSGGEGQRSDDHFEDIYNEDNLIDTSST